MTMDLVLNYMPAPGRRELPWGILSAGTMNLVGISLPFAFIPWGGINVGGFGFVIFVSFWSLLGCLVLSIRDLVRRRWIVGAIGCLLSFTPIAAFCIVADLLHLQVFSS
jgi:hypothetical protein